MTNQSSASYLIMIRPPTLRTLASSLRARTLRSVVAMWWMTAMERTASKLSSLYGSAMLSQISTWNREMKNICSPHIKASCRPPHCPFLSRARWGFYIGPLRCWTTRDSRSDIFHFHNLLKTWWAEDEHLHWRLEIWGWSIGLRKGEKVWSKSVWVLDNIIFRDICYTILLSDYRPIS